MTAAASAPREIGGLRRAAMWLAHQQPIVLVLALVLVSAQALSESGWLWVVSAVACGAGLVTIGVEYWHAGHLCQRCAARIPLDGRAVAERNELWLRVHHWGLSPGSLLVQGVAFAFCIAGQPQWLAPVSFMLLWVVTVIANLVHRPLARWCPQCEGWWGGRRR